MGDSEAVVGDSEAVVGGSEAIVGYSEALFAHVCNIMYLRAINSVAPRDSIIFQNVV